MCCFLFLLTFCSSLHNFHVSIFVEAPEAGKGVGGLQMVDLGRLFEQRVAGSRRNLSCSLGAGRGATNASSNLL